MSMLMFVFFIFFASLIRFFSSSSTGLQLKMIIRCFCDLFCLCLSASCDLLVFVQAPQDMSDVLRRR
jgi:hypothetical protein